MPTTPLREQMEKDRAERLEQARIEENKSPREKINDRIADLKRLQTEGEQKLQLLDEQRATLQETQARIAGALTVLAEEVTKLDRQAT